MIFNAKPQIIRQKKKVKAEVEKRVPTAYIEVIGHHHGTS